MRQKKIYTCGKMSGISYEEQMKWRNEVEYEVVGRNTGWGFTFVHPPKYYNYEIRNHQSEREILEWEMTQLHDSDIVVVNLDQIDTTIGSHMELGAVQAINMFGNKHIFVIGIIGNSDVLDLHPWIKEVCMRFEKTPKSAAEYISSYLFL